MNVRIDFPCSDDKCWAELNWESISYPYSPPHAFKLRVYPILPESYGLTSLHDYFTARMMELFPELHLTWTGVTI